MKVLHPIRLGNLLPIVCLVSALILAPTSHASATGIHSSGTRVGRTSDLGARSLGTSRHRLGHAFDRSGRHRSNLHRRYRDLSHKKRHHPRRHGRRHLRDHGRGHHRHHGHHGRFGHHDCRHPYGYHTHGHRYRYRTFHYPIAPVVVATTPYFCQACGIGFAGESVFFSHVHRFHGVAFNAIVPACVTVGNRLIYVGY